MRSILSRHPVEQLEQFIDHAGLLVVAHERTAQLPPDSARLESLKRTLNSTIEYQKLLVRFSPIPPKSRQQEIQDFVRGIYMLDDAMNAAGGLKELFQARETPTLTIDPKTTRILNQARADGPEAMRALWTGVAAEIKGSHPPLTDLEQSYYETMNAVRMIESLIKQEIAKLPRRRGRGLAKYSELIEEVAYAYLYILKDKPKATRGGEFHQLAAQITGERDPDRAVRRAVAAIRKDS